MSLVHLELFLNLTSLQISPIFTILNIWNSSRFMFGPQLCAAIHLSYILGDFRCLLWFEPLPICWWLQKVHFQVRETPPPPELQTPIPKCIVTILEDELKLSILKTKFALLLSTPALLLCRSVASIRCPVTPARSLKSNPPSTIFHIPDSINWAISPHM